MIYEVCDTTTHGHRSQQRSEKGGSHTWPQLLCRSLMRRQRIHSTFISHASHGRTWREVNLKRANGDVEEQHEEPPARAQTGDLGEAAQGCTLRCVWGLARV